MDTRLILESFNPNLDQNDDASFLGGGTYGKLYKAMLRGGIVHKCLPEETAVKCMKWKFPGGSGYEETEQNLATVGLNFANDNLVQLASAPQNYCWTGMINEHIIILHVIFGQLES